MNAQDRKILDRMFQPRGVAVFGAVHETGKFGHMIIQSFLQYGYPGKLYPIYPGGGEVFGLKVRHNLKEVNGPIDLAIICVPADDVPDVLKACLNAGVPGAEIISSGFAETGKKEGLALQSEIARISKQGIRILGPNCFGAHCPKGGITLLPGFDFSKESGPVALISQSGGVAADFGHEARIAGLGLSKVLSFGNGCDLDAVRLLDYLLDDGDTQYIGGYLEGIREGRNFVEILKRVASKKPVVLWKGGLTPLGNRAARSHTGSLGGEIRIWKGLLKQTGAVSVEGLEEMVDTMKALYHFREFGRRIALVGGGGAIGVFTSDLAHRWELEIPTFGNETQKRLRKWLPPPGNSVANPLDTGSPVLPLDVLTDVMKLILKRESLDVVVLVLLLHPMGLVMPTYLDMDGLPFPKLNEYLEGLLASIEEVREQSGKEVVLIMENRANLPGDVEIEKTGRTFQLRYHASGIPVYPTVERALRAIRNAYMAKKRRNR